MPDSPEQLRPPFRLHTRMTRAALLRNALRVIVALWFVGTSAFWLCFRHTAGNFWTGLSLAPRIAAQMAVMWLLPGIPYAGLGSGPAVRELRRDFGQGIRPADGRRLYDRILARRYTRGLEVGAAHGYASVWMALALARNGGKLTTIEIDLAAARIAERNFHAAGLDHIIDLRDNDALREIPALSGPFDFVLFDPGVPLNKRLFELVRPRLAPGATVAMHNALLLPLAEPAYLRAVTSDPALTTRILPTPSTGFAFTTLTRTPPGSQSRTK